MAHVPSHRPAFVLLRSRSADALHMKPLTTYPMPRAKREGRHAAAKSSTNLFDPALLSSGLRYGRIKLTMSVSPIAWGTVMACSPNGTTNQDHKIDRTNPYQRARGTKASAAPSNPSTNVVMKVAMNTGSVVSSLACAFVRLEDQGDHCGLAQGTLGWPRWLALRRGPA